MKYWICTLCNDRFDSVITILDSDSKDWVVCDVHGLSLHIDSNVADVVLARKNKMRRDDDGREYWD